MSHHIQIPEGENRHHHRECNMPPLAAGSWYAGQAGMEYNGVVKTMGQCNMEA